MNVQSCLAAAATPERQAGSDRTSADDRQVDALDQRGQGDHGGPVPVGDFQHCGNPL